MIWGGCGSAEGGSAEPPVCLLHPGILFSSQPSLGEREPPFRLPQEHVLFERLREMVTKGKYQRGLKWVCLVL